MAKSKRPSDVNQLAKSIVDQATGESPKKDEDREVLRAAASALGKKGGLKGGPARAKALSKARRSEIAKKAAQKRWQKKSGENLSEQPNKDVDPV